MHNQTDNKPPCMLWCYLSMMLAHNKREVICDLVSTTLRGIWSIVKLCMTFQTAVPVPNSQLVTIPMLWVLIWWLRVLWLSNMFSLWCCWWMLFMFKTPHLKSGWHVCQTSQKMPILFILLCLYHYSFKIEDVLYIIFSCWHSKHLTCLCIVPVIFERIERYFPMLNPLTEDCLNTFSEGRLFFSRITLLKAFELFMW